jgi:cell division protein FtsI (penicillin-binding protein 3)
VVDTSLVKVGSKIIMDEHPHGELGLARILALSSNVGMTKIALALEPQQLWGTLTRLGFGHVTASGFPGESAGVLSNYGSWRPIGIASLSYGYGLSVTPLQLAQAYATVGAFGVARPVSMLKVEGNVAGERVLSEQNARTLISLLESVVSEGTGTKAAIAGYRVAGKTGTAQKNAGGNYFDDHHTSVFGGLAPATQPRLAAVVVIDDPAAGRYYGGDVAAPVFSAVMGSALRLMGVAPDAAPGPAADPLTGVTTVVRR